MEEPSYDHEEEVPLHGGHQLQAAALQVAGLVVAGLLLSRMLAGPLVSMAYPSVME